MNPYHSFLLKHRIWCERCSDLTPAQYVRKFNGHDEVLCREHTIRLDSVRKSEKSFENKMPQTYMLRIEIT